MAEEIAYMGAATAAVFAANYFLRALPFLLFGRGGGGPPRSVERFGAFISPVAIAALVVYAYTQLEPPVSAAYAPYAAGAAAVALQLAFKSGILSVAASTALYMYLVA